MDVVLTNSLKSESRQMSANRNFYRDSEGQSLIWEREYEQLRIEAYGTDGLRIRATVGANIADLPYGALLPLPASQSTIIEIGSNGAAITNGNLRAEVSARGYIRFFKVSDGAILLEETAPSSTSPVATNRIYRPLSGESSLFHIEANFKAQAGERFYGLGQHRHGLLDQKGCVVDLAQQNCEVAIPFLVSSRGYGFLWHSPAIGRVELGYNGTRWVSTAQPQIDYLVVTGDSYPDIMERYAEATGHAPLLPEWASGFWQSKLRYTTQDELLAVAREHKRRNLPLSVMVVDFFHWQHMGDWSFDPVKWPDPAAMVKELAEMGVRLMVSIWPAVNPESVNFKALLKEGLLVRTKRGPSVLFGFIDTYSSGRVYFHYYDPTNPKAREFIWQQARQNYLEPYGIKVWWLDACEPEIWPRDYDNLRYYVGEGQAVSLLYPFMHQQAFYEGMQAAGEDEVVLLCRSAWAGSQRFGAAVWSGDVDPTFETLRGQLKAGLNMGLSGIPWWTTDIGGFHGGDPDSPAYRELLVRWFQFGVFCPLTRLHGFREPRRDGMGQSGGPNEVWSYGEEAYKIIEQLLFLRERLRPYVMEQMRLAHEKGTPVMRPLFFDFPDDPRCYEIDDQYMFGPDLLITPVMEAGQRQRAVYLPDGTTWKDAWSGEVLEGGQLITVPAPLERIPVFIRQDAQLEPEIFSATSQ